MLLILTVISALCLDWRVGEPLQFHPLVGFGNLAHWLENRLNHLNHQRSEEAAQKLQTHKTGMFGLPAIVVGGIATLLLIAPLACLVFILSNVLPLFLSITLDIVILYWAIGHQSLREHVQRVLACCLQGDLLGSQHQLAMIVSRNTEQLNEKQVIQATIETVLENGSDAIFAPLFWFCLLEMTLNLGATAVVIYRLSNTLDAMWGYRNQRFNHFGRVAARLDDVLNYLPARLVALSYALLGQTKLALKCWRQQSPLLNSPNAGPVMTAGAGSLNIQLGGPAYYHQVYTDKPYFGSDRPVTVTDITRSLQLILRTLVLWCLLIIVIIAAF